MSDLTQLDEATLRACIEDGTINPKTEQSHVADLIRKARSANGAGTEKDEGKPEKPIPACVAEVKTVIARTLGGLSAAERCQLFALIHNLLATLQVQYARADATSARSGQRPPPHVAHRAKPEQLHA